MNIKSHSQAGQDVFAYAICATDSGTFLDIGSGNPVAGNNSFSLELKGWSGIAIDKSVEFIKAYSELRKTPLTVLDMTRVDWDRLIAEHPLLNGVVDYFSLDVDMDTLSVLRGFPFDKLRFRAATIEHDVYRYGDAVRREMRSIMSGAGYELIAADVIVHFECPESEAYNGSVPFEDWYIKPGSVDMTTANEFRSNNKDWSEVIKRYVRKPH